MKHISWIIIGFFVAFLVFTVLAFGTMGARQTHSFPSDRLDVACACAYWAVAGVVIGWFLCDDEN